jgi:hypothetical protein
MALTPNPEANSRVPLHEVVPVEQMAGEDEEDTALLREMLERATKYIRGFSWCESVVATYFAGGVGKVFAIFLFEINTRRMDVDRWEWIFVGDVPSAYLPLEDAPSKMEAFEEYIAGMKRWAEFAHEGQEPTIEDRCPPVNVPATPEWADVLEGKLKFLEEYMRPVFE